MEPEIGVTSRQDVIPGSMAIMGRTESEAGRRLGPFDGGPFWGGCEWCRRRAARDKGARDAEKHVIRRGSRDADEHVMRSARDRACVHVTQRVRGCARDEAWLT